MQRLACLFLTLLLGWVQAYADSEADEAQEAKSEAVEQEGIPKQPTFAELEAMRVALPGRNQHSLQRLQQQYPQEFIELAGAEEVFAALWSPANAPQATGQVIILPDLLQPADAHGAVSLLRYAVNDKGWHSLSLHLPDPNFIALHVSPLPQPEPSQELAPDELSDDVLLPAKEDAEDADEQQLSLEQAVILEDSMELESESEQETIVAELESQPQFVDRFAAQLDMALEHDKSRPLLVLAVGQSAGLVLEYLQWQPQQNAKIAQVILLEPRQYEAGKPITELIEQSQLPVTEFYTASQKWQQEQARQRLNAGKRKRAGVYQQVRLEAAFPDQAEQANRRIVGWLYKNQTKFQ